VYIGQTLNLNQRYAEHAAKPPPRMRADAKRYAPFREHFLMVPLFKRWLGREADYAERCLIDQHQARGPKGYNVLRGAPRRDARVHAMIKQRKIQRTHGA